MTSQNNINRLQTSGEKKTNNNVGVAGYCTYNSIAVLNIVMLHINTNWRRSGFLKLKWYLLM